ncbi:MAG: DUF1214 domain-containing protein [Kofleriaceae bacterium]|nr:DUF1214 domain-containing protein [Kofleriaceae bacterium]
MPTKDQQTTSEEALRAGTTVAMQQAIDAAIWGTPIVSFDAMREAYFRDARAEFNDIVYLSGPADWQFRITTPNASSHYVLCFFNTGDGPVLLDVPPAVGAGLFGSILDAWQVPLVDIGPEGMDSGKGGRYVLLPPDYHGDPIPDAIPVRLDTYNGYFAFRSSPEDASEEGVKRANALIKKLRVYPYARIDQPPEQMFIDMEGKLFDGVMHFDERFFASLWRMIDEEPAFERDAEILGVLATLGIEKGKNFAPDPALRQLLGAAARAAHDQLVEATPNNGPEAYAGRHWRTANEVGAKTAFRFVTDDGLDARARAEIFFLACAPPAKLGRATFYLAAYEDAESNELSGERTYRLHVPADVPARQFWAVTVYARDDAAFIRDAPLVELSSYDHEFAKNDDGSVDVYFGPNAPAGHEANWIYTSPNANWFAFFRLYGPEPAAFDKSWQLPDIEPYTELH